MKVMTKDDFYVEMKVMLKELLDFLFKINPKLSQGYTILPENPGVRQIQLAYAFIKDVYDNYYLDAKKVFEMATPDYWINIRLIDEKFSYSEDGKLYNKNVKPFVEKMTRINRPIILNRSTIIFNSDTLETVLKLLWVKYHYKDDINIDVFYKVIKSMVKYYPERFKHIKWEETDKFVKSKDLDRILKDLIDFKDLNRQTSVFQIVKIQCTEEEVLKNYHYKDLETLYCMSRRIYKTLLRINGKWKKGLYKNGPKKTTGKAKRNARFDVHNEATD